mgnify:CR=1 FL=1
MVFSLEDNGYAISVPVEVQTAGGDISKLVSGFPNLYRQTLRRHRSDRIAWRSMRRAVDNCRKNRGHHSFMPKVIRPYSHSLSDDEKLYRREAERVADAERDPVKRFRRVAGSGRALPARTSCRQLKDEIDREINEAADAALASPQPAADTAIDFIYSPTVDPTVEGVRHRRPASS